MADTPVVVIARVKAKPGLELTLRAQLLSMSALAIEEDGCLKFRVHQGKDDPSLFMSYEKWTRPDDLHRHLQMSYMKEFTEKAPEMLAGPPDITLWVEL
jgi:quinol monooxygenase YgiN